MVTKKLNIEDYTVEDATHKLRSRHCIGRSCRYYEIDCVLIKDMGDGRSKIIAFGDRNWKNTDHIKRIRYVSTSRLKKIEPAQQQQENESR